LSRVISKGIQADLKKYKMGKGAKGAPLRDRTRSPGKRDDDYAETFDAGSMGDLSK